MTCLTSKHITERLLLSMTLHAIPSESSEEGGLYIFPPGKHKELGSENVEKTVLLPSLGHLSPTPEQ